MSSEDRLPPPQTYAEFNERARCLAVLHEMSVTSGGRSEERNAAVGGNENSWHRWARGGMGWDLAPPASLPPGESRTTRIANAAVDARVLGMDAVEYDTHLHIEPADA